MKKCIFNFVHFARKTECETKTKEMESMTQFTTQEIDRLKAEKLKL